MVTSDYAIIAGTPQPHKVSCLLYCAMADSNRSQWGLLKGGAKPDRSRNTADHSGNWANSLAILMTKNNTQRS